MADTAQTETLHQTSLAVWDIPPAVAAGERFAVKAGGEVVGRLRARRLPHRGAGRGGCGGGVRPARRRAVARHRARSTGPRSSCARRRRRGLSRLRCASTRRELDEPHEDASSPFNVSVVARPEHTLTVTVASGGMPVEEAYIRLGPYRATTDAAGAAPRSNWPRAATSWWCGRRDTTRRRCRLDDRRGCRRRGRGAGAAGGRSRRGLDGVSGVI